MMISNQNILKLDFEIANHKDVFLFSMGFFFDIKI